MKRFYLPLCLLVIVIAQCFAGGPAADIYVDTLNIVDGAVSAIKTDGSLMLTDGSNSAENVEFQNLNVVASFTIGGVDVLGDIDAALTAILGE